MNITQALRYLNPLRRKPIIMFENPRCCVRSSISAKPRDYSRPWLVDCDKRSFRITRDQHDRFFLPHNMAIALENTFEAANVLRSRTSE